MESSVQAFSSLQANVEKTVFDQVVLSCYFSWSNWSRCFFPEYSSGLWIYSAIAAGWPNMVCLLGSHQISCIRATICHLNMFPMHSTILAQSWSQQPLLFLHKSSVLHHGPIFHCNFHNAPLTFFVKACHSKSSHLTHCSSATLALSVMAPGTALSFSSIGLSHTGFLPELQLGQVHNFLKMFQEWLPCLEHSPSRHTASVSDPSLGL